MEKKELNMQNIQNEIPSWKKLVSSAIVEYKIRNYLILK